jgi:prophage maintenance system killer protein
LFTGKININPNVKRTGMATIRILILNNGYQFNATNDEITQMARCIANYRESKITKTDLSTWIEEKIEQ